MIPGIPDSEIDLTFARSSGKGGQNVNKVNSKAVLRWNIRHNATLPIHVKARFYALFGARITNDGDIVITSETHRDQKKNINECFEKLAALIEQARHIPKTRRPTKPTKSSKNARHESKKRHGATKKQRARIKEW